jgi:hypothetical protein
MNSTSKPAGFGIDDIDNVIDALERAVESITSAISYCKHSGVENSGHTQVEFWEMLAKRRQGIRTRRRLVEQRTAMRNAAEALQDRLAAAELEGAA